MSPSAPTLPLPDAPAQRPAAPQPPSRAPEQAQTADESLLAAYQDGDERAFAQLFERYASRIYAVCIRHGFTPADAQDLVQQTFVQAHQARHDYKRGAPLRPWLWTIAYNLMRDAGRRRSARRRAMDAFARTRHAGEELKRGHAHAEARLGLHGALERLSPALREVLWLHYYEDLSFAEIARVLALKESAVRVRAHRGYQQLRHILGEGAAHGAL